MMRILAAGVAALAALLPLQSARAQSEEQTLVDRSTLALQDMMSQTVSDTPRTMLQRARGVMICPQVFKAGFIFGGEGGACVLLARAGNGTWSYPAFYGMGSGSVGFQIGIQDAQLILMIVTDKGLNAMLDSQFKLGADASIAIATIGGGVEGATTGAVGADIVAFSQTRGLFGGISIGGTLMGARSEWNRVYYGHDVSTRQIVIDMQAANPGADPLREILTRFGNGDGPAAVASIPPPPSAGAAASGMVPMQPTSRGAVQQQNLAPPRQ